MSSRGFNPEYRHSEFYFDHGRPVHAVVGIGGDGELVSLGIDDTDSATLGMCTTYIGALLADALVRADLVIGFTDYPRLVRLNPQVPNKTRGNGAVALSFLSPTGCSGRIIDMAEKIIQGWASLEDDATHPGLALLRGEVGPGLRSFYRRCLHRIVSLDEALALAESERVETRGFKQGLGIIGAIAAIGVDFAGDHTFEVIAYRDASDRSRERGIDDSLVIRMDAETEGTFYNYDYANGKSCIVPASPCPVYFGVRGESPGAVKRAYDILGGDDAPVAVIFRTNQHTDAHIERLPNLGSIVERSSVSVAGRVLERPHAIEGGHVIFSIGDRTAVVDCAAYEPTKQFRDVIRDLEVGDTIRVFGSVRPSSPDHGPTINLEKIQILELVGEEEVNPTCPKCGSRMESMGRDSGYRCRKGACRFRSPGAGKERVKLDRSLEIGFYEPPPVAWRHLYKPLLRGVDHENCYSGTGSGSSAGISAGVSRLSS